MGFFDRRLEEIVPQRQQMTEREQIHSYNMKEAERILPRIVRQAMLDFPDAARRAGTKTHTGIKSVFSKIEVWCLPGWINYGSSSVAYKPTMDAKGNVYALNWTGEKRSLTKLSFDKVSQSICEHILYCSKDLLYGRMTTAELESFLTAEVENSFAGCL